MYYRLEAEHNNISIRHVETDRELGYVRPGEYIHPDYSGTFHGCRIFDMAGHELATVTTLHHSRPMSCAAVAVANEQQHYNFRDLKGAARNDLADRVERRLGTLLVDAIFAFSRCLFDTADDGPCAETKEEFARSLTELTSLWWVSRSGCFNATRRTHESYFSNLLASEPRLSFSGAAQIYGIRELHSRHPNLTDAELRRALGWALQWLSDLLLRDLDERSATQAQQGDNVTLIGRTFTRQASVTSIQ
jgi:hypothetical protein